MRRLTILVVGLGLGVAAMAFALVPAARRPLTPVSTGTIEIAGEPQVDELSAAAPESSRPRTTTLIAPPAGRDATDARPIVFPDGRSLAPLNGVRSAPDPKWRSGRPYSPVVTMEVRNGLEWYVHVDGSRTTTLSTWRADLGRFDAVTHVQHPGSPVPIRVEDD